MRTYHLAVRTRKDSINKPVSRRESAAIHVRDYHSANWFTARGVHRKLKDLERKGLPDFTDWRFVTLTLSPEMFESPLDGFLQGRDKLRRFVEKLRKLELIPRSARWCWKLEFQANGWAHWHFLIERKNKFTVEEMAAIKDAWGYGRTNIKRVWGGDFAYAFKYVFKRAASDDANDLPVPNWFADYYVAGDKERKTLAFSRVRFFQTSRGFYESPPVSDVCQRKKPMYSYLPRSVRAVIDEAASRVCVVARDRDGRYLKSQLLILTVSSAFLWGAAAKSFFLFDVGAPLGINSFLVSKTLLENNSNERWKINRMAKINRLRVSDLPTLEHSIDWLRS